MGALIKNKKAIWIGGLALLLGFVILDGYNNPFRDFNTFIGASRLIAEGKTCYNVWIHSGTSGLMYYYSPFFALLVTPLTYLPDHAYNSIWVLCNIFFSYRIFRLIGYYLDVSILSNKYKKIFYFSVILCCIRFLLYNFSLGQMTIFLVFASLESIRLITEDKKVQGSALLALAINIKLLPLTLLCYLLYRAEYRAALWVVFFSVLLLFIPSLFIGVDFNMLLLRDWMNSMQGTINSSISDDIGRESLSALLPAYFMEIQEKITLPRNIFNLSSEAATIIINVARFALVAFTLYFLRFPPFKNARNRMNNFYALSYICLITPLIAPHQGKYSFFYILPAFAYINFALLSIFSDKKSLPFLKDKIAAGFVIVSFAFTTLTTDGLIGRGNSDIANYYHLITIGTLLLVIPLAVLKPEKIDSYGSSSLGKLGE